MYDPAHIHRQMHLLALTLCIARTCDPSWERPTHFAQAQKVTCTGARLHLAASHDRARVLRRKKDWSIIFLELNLGKITMRVCKDGEKMRDGEVISTGSAVGCRVGAPKNARKSHTHAFRLDLASKDTAGITKYLLRPV